MDRSGHRGGGRVDLHVHSAWSGDNDADPEEILERALEAGLDGVAFTEHYLYGASAFAEELRERWRGRILVFRGVELSTEEGHCLVFGADTDRLGLGGAPLAEVVRAADDAGGVAVPAHPFRGQASAGDRLLDIPGLRSLEGRNGLNMDAMNRRALDLAAALGIPHTGGSDAHEPRHVGACHTLFEDRVTEANLVELLLRGGYRGVDARRPSRAWIPGSL